MNLRMKTLTNVGASVLMLFFALISYPVLADGNTATSNGFEKNIGFYGTGLIDPTNPSPRPGINDCDGLICGGGFFNAILCCVVRKR